MTSLVLGLAPASALADTTSTSTSTPPPTTPTTITLHASRTSFTGSRAIDLTGRVTGLPAGGAVNLIKIAYPYRTSQLVRSAHPGADGTFTFSVHPDRNVRYRVIVPGTTAQGDRLDQRLRAHEVLGQGAAAGPGADLGRRLSPPRPAMERRSRELVVR